MPVGYLELMSEITEPMPPLPMVRLSPPPLVGRFFVEYSQRN